MPSPVFDAEVDDATKSEEFYLVEKLPLNRLIQQEFIEAFVKKGKTQVYNIHVSTYSVMCVLVAICVTSLKLVNVVCIVMYQCTVVFAACSIFSLSQSRVSNIYF